MNKKDNLAEIAHALGLPAISPETNQKLNNAALAGIQDAILKCPSYVPAKFRKEWLKSRKQVVAYATKSGE